MNDYKLFPAEYKMMDLFWDSQPVTTPELARLCGEKYGWKKNTTFTQIRRMVERGFIRKEGMVLYTAVTREAVEMFDSSEIVSTRFSGSLPKFVAAFFGGNRISARELEELRKLYEEHIEE